MENLAPSNVTIKSSKTIEEIYQKKTHLEQILLRPETYIGSVQRDTEKWWILNEEHQSMELRNLSFVPGLFKIVDEIIVNAADNKQRDDSMDMLKVTVDEEKGSICVFNNGKGIPVEMHKKENVYVPELVFGHLLAGNNFNDDEKRTVGGRNGYGAKLANIFSKSFVVETCCNGTKFRQEYRNNMTERDAPKITQNVKDKDYTQVTFKPDFRRFDGMGGWEADIISLIQKRCYDIAGTCTSKKSLKVFWNGEQVKVKGFKEYVAMHLNKDEQCAPRVFERVNDRWEVAVSIGDGQNEQQMSFVNNICTSRGGSHVKYVGEQIKKGLLPAIQKKLKKDGKDLKITQLKNHVFVFVNCLVENPAFDTQTKTCLTTQAKSFGSTCEISEDFVKKAVKSGIADLIAERFRVSSGKKLTKGNGTKTARISGIPKLDDANEAGTKNSNKCTLILTEGDSAKALAISGLTVVGRDHFGVFPLKGKLLNVRDASAKQITENEEFIALKQILGLKQNVEYTDTKSLRYGSVMVMTDQDHDGSHIKGLLINMFQHFWPSLYRMPGFLKEFITPIVKCSKGKQDIAFYTIPEYESWKETNANGKGWKIKYYKGLGTSTAKEGREYFSNIDEHQKQFAWTGEHDDEAIKLAFAKDGADARKAWMSSIEPGTFLDMRASEISYADFVNRELILFSMASNVRAIPSVVDGLKPGQRKILFTCLKRKLFKEIKVAQLAGYVSADTAYHHGEASLTATIVCLAQNYTGSNNLNVLMPNGQFGTRIQGGKDAASARYIFTSLAPVCKTIFHEDDEKLLKYLDDDGLAIEPEWYVPVVPMVLINGSSGIGTGWSSEVPNYNPRDIVNNLRLLLEGKEQEMMHPWYKGFNGAIVPNNRNGNYTVIGHYEKVDDVTIVVSELPVGKWTHDFKLLLEGMVEKNQIKEFRDNHTDTTVHFTITLTPEQMADVESKSIDKVFKLTSSVATSNMVLFDKDGKLKKYNSANEILQDFFDIRLEFYEKRKQYLTSKLQEDVGRLQNKARFILAVIGGSLKIQRVKKAAVVAELIRQNYTPFPKQTKRRKAEDDAASDEENDEAALSDGKASDFDYLLSMPLWNLTEEKVNEMLKQRDEKERELQELMGTTTKEIWLRDLDRFEEALQAHEDLENEVAESEAALVKKAKAKKAGKKSKHADSDDEDDYAPSKASKKPTQSSKLPIVKALATKPSLPAKPASFSNAAIAAAVKPLFSKNPQVLSVAAPVPAPKIAIKAKPKAKTISIDSDDDAADCKPMDTDTADVASSAPADRPARQRKSINYNEDKSEVCSDQDDPESEEDEEQSDSETEPSDSEDSEAGSEDDWAGSSTKKKKQSVVKKSSTVPKNVPAAKAVTAKASVTNQKQPMPKPVVAAASTKSTTVKKAIAAPAQAEEEEAEFMSLADRLKLKAKPASSKSTGAIQSIYMDSNDEDVINKPGSLQSTKGSTAKSSKKDDESKAQTKSVKRSLAEKKASSPPGKSAATPEPKRQKSVKDFFKQAAPAAAKSKKRAQSEDEEEEHKPSLTSIAAEARPTRVRKVIKYTEPDSEEEEDDEVPMLDVDEEESDYQDDGDDDFEA